MNKLNILFVLFVTLVVTLQTRVLAGTTKLRVTQPEKTLLFVPLDLSKNIDVVRLAHALKIADNRTLDLASTNDLEKVIEARQSPESTRARDQIVAIATDLVKNKDKKNENQKTKQLSEIDEISQRALNKGWFGPFVAIRLFTFGIVRSDIQSLRLLFANSEDFPPHFPISLRETIDLGKAEVLATALKQNRSAMRTKMVLHNSHDWPQSRFCLYHLNGQPLAAESASAIAGFKHLLVESCVAGSQNILAFELKPYQREVQVTFSADSKATSLVKIAPDSWSTTLSPQLIHNILIVDSLSPSRVRATVETKQTANTTEIDFERIRKFDSPIEESLLPVWSTSFEVYPQIWWASGDLSVVMVEALPTGQFLGIGVSARYSDFALSLDTGMADFIDIDTAAWFFARAHWAKEFSLESLRKIYVKPLVGVGIMIIPESPAQNDSPLAGKLYASIGLTTTYRIDESVHFGVGGEFDFSFEKRNNRLIGLSLRVGYSF